MDCGVGWGGGYTGAMPMFCVIMPLYNHEAFVDEAIESVVKQTLGDWELIVVDDGSKDGSGAIADGWAGRDSRIRVIHQSNAGPAAARNRGMAQASGEWIALLDSDDMWFPQTLAHYAACIGNHPEARLVYGYRHRLRDGKVTELAGRYQDRVTGVKELFDGIYFESSCTTFRRELVELAGPMDVKLPPIEDYEFFLRLSLLTPLQPLGEATGLRRRHENNISRPCGENRLQEAAALEQFVTRAEVRSVLPASQIAARLGRVYHAAGREFGRAGKRDEARKALAKSLGYRFNLRTWVAMQASRMGL